MNKRDDEYFESSTKCQICGNIQVDGPVKLRDHSNIT